MKRAVVVSVLAVSLAGCARPSFEEQLSYLDLLKSRDRITEDEHSILRRRLVEEVDLATLKASSSPVPPLPAEPQQAPEPLLRAAPAPAPPAVAQREPEPLSADWVVGSWGGTHTGGGGWYWDVVTAVSFSLTGDELTWTMTRRFRSSLGNAISESSGTAVVNEDRLEMTGVYTNGSPMASEGTDVAYSLQRVGDSLEGLAVGADHRSRTLLLDRVRP